MPPEAPEVLQNLYDFRDRLNALKKGAQITGADAGRPQEVDYCNGVASGLDLAIDEFQKRFPLEPKL